MSSWNKNRSVGQKKPFSPQEVILLKGILKSRNQIRNLALLSLGIDSMLRAGDLLNLMVDDLIDYKGNVKEEISIKQQKTKLNHIFVISQETQKTVSAWLKISKKFEGDYLFSSSTGKKPLTVRRYRDIVKEWVKLLGLDYKNYSTHSIRRTKSAYIYKKTGNIEVVRLLLGQKSVSSTSSYLNIDKKEAWKISKEYDL